MQPLQTEETGEGGGVDGGGVPQQGGGLGPLPRQARGGGKLLQCRGARGGGRARHLHLSHLHREYHQQPRHNVQYPGGFAGVCALISPSHLIHDDAYLNIL